MEYTYLPISDIEWEKKNYDDRIEHFDPSYVHVGNFNMVELLEPHMQEFHSGHATDLKKLGPNAYARSQVEAF